MLNGLLTYTRKYGIVNLGDYIQSLAAKQFLDHVDVLVGREELDLYAGNDTRLIMNGWFMHEPGHWPPSPRIYPLFVAFHINSVAREALTRSASITYLQQHAPIGCRDRYTVRLLQECGVEAYFSGCLTLTLGLRYGGRECDETIYFVDPYYECRRTLRDLLGYVRTLVVRFQVIRRITVAMKQRQSPRHLLRVCAFYQTYSQLFTDDVLTTAVYTQHMVTTRASDKDAELFDCAEALLRKYASAAFVITSRIHCALPCLGMGTPVLYVADDRETETSVCRLDGLLELLHVISHKHGTLSCKLTRGKIATTFRFSNHTLWRPLADRLAAACSAFTT